jgi:hypothetical protein
MAGTPKILERMQIAAAIMPVSNAGATNTGDYVSLKNYGRCGILIVGSAGDAGDDLSVKVYQAKDVSGTSAKVLNALETGRIYTKNNADVTTVAQWTEETQDTADELYDDTTSGEVENLWFLEIEQTDLDVANGFDCIRVDTIVDADGKILTALYLLADPRYAKEPDEMLGAIAD